MRYVFLIPTRLVPQVFKSAVLSQKNGISCVQDNTFSNVISRNAQEFPGMVAVGVTSKQRMHCEGFNTL